MTVKSLFGIIREGIFLFAEDITTVSDSFFI